MTRWRALLLTLLLVALGAAGLVALLGGRGELTSAWLLGLRALATAPSTLAGLVAAAALAGLLLWGLMLRREIGERSTGLLRGLRRAPVATPQTVDAGPAWEGAMPPALGQEWLKPGDAQLLAGAPQTLGPLVASLLGGGAQVLLLASKGRAAAVERSLDQLDRQARDRLTLLPNIALGAQLAESLARAPAGRPAVVVIDGAARLGSWGLAEREESRLGRFVRVVRPMLTRRGAALILLEPLAPERVLIPDEIGAAFLGQLDGARLWDGHQLVTPQNGTYNLANWLVNFGKGEAWTRAGERVAGALWATISLALIGGLALALVAPAAKESNGQILLLGGDGASLPGSLWANWWVAQAIEARDLGSLIFSKSVYWPLGDSLITRFGSLGAAVLSVPFQALGSYPGYWTTFVWAALATNGLSAMALARSVGASRSGALLSGVIFTVCPPLLDAVTDGHEQLFWAFALPMAIRAAWLATHSSRRLAGLLAGVWLGVAGLMNWFYVLFALLVIVPLAAWTHVTDRDPETRAVRRAQLVRAVRCFLPFTLAAGPLIAEATRARMIGLSFGEPAELLGGTPIGDTLLKTMIAHSSAPWALAVGGPDIGPARVLYVAVLATLLGWIAWSRGRRLTWVGLCLLAAMLALGPYLTGQSVARSWLTLPYASLYTWLPFFSRLHHPDRMLILAGLLLAVIAGLLWPRLADQLRSPGREALILGAFGLACFSPWTSGLAPLSTTTFSVPDVYQVLSGQGALVELPLNYREDAILYQPLHGHPLVNGPGEYLESQSRGVMRDTMWTSPVLRFLWESGTKGFTQQDLAFIYDQGLRYILVNDAVMSRLLARNESGAREAVYIASQVDGAFGPPIVHNGQYRLYRVPRSTAALASQP